MKSNTKTHHPPPGIVIPHHVPAHVFHIAQVAAFQRIRETITAIPPEGLSLSCIDDILSHQTQNAWDQFCRLALPNMGTPEQCPLPNMIQLDPRESIPVSIWNEDTQDLTDAWGMFLVTPENNKDIVPLTLSSPFQPVSLSLLPEDQYRKIPLTDQRHTALAIMVEIIISQHKDVIRLANAHEEKLAWRQMQVLRSWYASVANTVFEHLPKDHLRDWGDNHDGYENLNQSLLYIAKNGMTVLSQKALAFQHLSQYFTRLLNHIDDTYSRDPDAAMQEFLAVLTQDACDLEAQLSGMNIRFLASKGLRAESFDYVVSFPANTKELPAILAVDKATIPPTLVKGAIKN